MPFDYIWCHVPASKPPNWLPITCNEMQTHSSLLTKPLAAHLHLSLSLQFPVSPMYAYTQCSCKTHSHPAPPERHLHPASRPHACCSIPCLDPFPLFLPCLLLCHLKVTELHISSWSHQSGWSLPSREFPNSGCTWKSLGEFKQKLYQCPGPPFPRKIQPTSWGWGYTWAKGVCRESALISIGTVYAPQVPGTFAITAVVTKWKFKVLPSHHHHHHNSYLSHQWHAILISILLFWFLLFKFESNAHLHCQTTSQKSSWHMKG